MATKKKATRKTAKKKSGTAKKKKAASKGGVRKKAAKKRVAARRPSAPARAKKKRSAPKKKVAKKKRKSKTAAERRADRAIRPTRRKPETGGQEAKNEILAFFGAENTRGMTAAELTALKVVFLRAYANRGIMRDGCVAAGISVTAFKNWRTKDEDFNSGCEHAEMLAADRLEAEAHRRAHDGYDKPIIYQGEITNTYREYSDSLMATLMRGYKPERYKERTEHSGSVGRPMTLDEESKEEVVSSILGMIRSKKDPT